MQTVALLRNKHTKLFGTKWCSVCSPSSKRTASKYRWQWLLSSKPRLMRNGAVFQILPMSCCSAISLSREKHHLVQQLEHHKLEEWTALLLSFFPHWVHYVVNLACQLWQLCRMWLPFFPSQCAPLTSVSLTTQWKQNVSWFWFARNMLLNFLSSSSWAFPNLNCRLPSFFISPTRSL